MPQNKKKLQMEKKLRQVLFTSEVNEVPCNEFDWEAFKLSYSFLLVYSAGNNCLQTQ